MMQVLLAWVKIKALFMTTVKMAIISCKTPTWYFFIHFFLCDFFSYYLNLLVVKFLVVLFLTSSACKTKKALEE